MNTIKENSDICVVSHKVVRNQESEYFLTLQLLIGKVMIELEYFYHSYGLPLHSLQSSIEDEVFKVVLCFGNEKLNLCRMPLGFIETLRTNTQNSFGSLPAGLSIDACRISHPWTSGLVSGWLDASSDPSLGYGSHSTNIAFPEEVSKICKQFFLWAKYGFFASRHGQKTENDLAIVLARAISSRIEEIKSEYTACIRNNERRSPKGNEKPVFLLSLQDYVVAVTGDGVELCHSYEPSEQERLADVKREIKSTNRNYRIVEYQKGNAEFEQFLEKVLSLKPEQYKPEITLFIKGLKTKESAY